jgi:hypothetical protein
MPKQSQPPLQSVLDLLNKIDKEVQQIKAQQLTDHAKLQSTAAVVDQIFKLIKPSIPPAAALKFTWETPPHPKSHSSQRTFLFQQQQGGNMSVTLNPGQAVSFTVSPVNAQGGASQATLSKLTYASSDAAVFSVAPDPNNANGGIVTAGTNLPTTPDAAVITASATATEPDGVTTETISGQDTVTVITTPPPPPPPPVAASLVFNWGVPQKK